MLRWHEGRVWACAFSPDGRGIASAGADGTLRLWDVDSGRETGWRYHFFSGGAWAVLDPAGNRVLGCGGEAWRWLGWLAPDPATGRLTRYPAETFGPLPGETGSSDGE